MDDASLLQDLDHGVPTLTLNRSGKLNAIDNTLARELLATLQPGVVGAFKRVLNQVGLPAFTQAVELEHGPQRLLARRPPARPLP